mmetsp:Transcript_30530/g.81441  ORF Transcript_30530/g.81441 Transcript_30530/m.81441 type:complete len:121 (-) Transcript_30530:1665-2027(-)
MRAQWTASPPGCLIMKPAVAHTADSALAATRVNPGPTRFCIVGKTPRATDDEMPADQDPPHQKSQPESASHVGQGALTCSTCEEQVRVLAVGPLEMSLHEQGPENPHSIRHHAVDDQRRQ